MKEILTGKVLKHLVFAARCFTLKLKQSHYNMKQAHEIEILEN